MIGTRRVRSVPRMSSASSNPFIPGIWTSSRASAKSWTRSNSRASGPDLTLSNSSPSRRNNASSARRFSSRSSTNRHLSLSLDIQNASKSEAYPELSSLHVLPVDALLADEFGEGFGVAGKAQALLRAQAQKTFSGQRILEEADGAILQLPVEVDEHVATRN